MKGNARGNWDSREGQQPFRPNLNGTGDRITTLRRLLIGAVHLLSYGCYLIDVYLIGFILSYWFYLIISSFILLVHLLSYERALRLPTSFPISGLARLGVRPRLCRSSWRALASTHPLMLFSTCSREALLALAPCPPWNLPSFTVESTLSSPCSRSDPPLSRQGAVLAHLDPLPLRDLVLWTDGSAPFPFDKGGSGVLVNCSLCGTEATLSFSAGPVCSSFSAEACAIRHALCWSRQHQQVCHFSSLLFSSCLTLVLSSPPSFLLSQTVWQICLRSPSVLLDYNGSPDTRFSRGSTRLMSWPDGERCLRPLQSLVVSLLLSLVLSRTGGVLSYRSSLTHRFLDFHQGTCAPSSCSLCPLSSSLQRTQPSVRFLFL